MSAKLLDSVQEFLLKLSGKSNTPDRPEVGIYQGDKIYVYSRTTDYILVSFRDDGTGMFSVKPEEVK